MVSFYDRITLGEVEKVLCSDEKIQVSGAWFDRVEAIKEGRPVGLEHFGSWPTIQEGLSQLPPEVQKSWFRFDKKTNGISRVEFKDAGGDVTSIRFEDIKLNEAIGEKVFAE